MWQNVKHMAAEFFETHRGRKQGFFIGVSIGIAILIFGFFNTLFAFGCGFIGLYIGAKLDGGDDLIEKTLERLDKILPDKLFRR